MQNLGVGLSVGSCMAHITNDKEPTARHERKSEVSGQVGQVSHGSL